MKRFILIIVLVTAALALSAAPALAWYAPQPQTAYIDYWSVPHGWLEWNGPGDPYGATIRRGAIPRGWDVVVATSWADSRRGAEMAPANMQHGLTVAKQGGGWQLRVRLPGSSFWSPVYAWGPSLPGAWARDWWVPLGKLAPGDYSGTVRDVAPRAFPTWLDEEGFVTEPIIMPAWDETIPISFTVR